MNVKIHREILGISQERLAEKAGISSNMVKDIEGCRSWVSDKTLLKLAIALETDVYRLFISSTVSEEEIHRAMVTDFAEILKKIRKDVSSNVESALKIWDVGE